MVLSRSGWVLPKGSVEVGGELIGVDIDAKRRAQTDDAAQRFRAESEAAVPPAREKAAADTGTQTLLDREPPELARDRLEQIEEPADVIFDMVVRARERSSAVDQPHPDRP
jgi:hypothetical protein